MVLQVIFVVVVVLIITSLSGYYRDLKKFRAPLKTPPLLCLPALSHPTISNSVCCWLVFFFLRPKLPILPRGSGGFSLTNRALSEPMRLAALSLATTARPFAVELQCGATGNEDVDGDRRRGQFWNWSSPPFELDSLPRTSTSSSPSGFTSCAPCLHPTRVASHDRLASLLDSRRRERFSLSTNRMWNLFKLP